MRSNAHAVYLSLPYLAIFQLVMRVRPRLFFFFFVENCLIAEHRLLHCFTGYRWFVGARGPWIAISFLYCLQTSTAATYRDAIFRTVSLFVNAKSPLKD